MPNRREPLTNEMVHYIQDKGKTLEKQGLKDNLYLSMSNWLTLGMQGGFRISEWAQTNVPPNQLHTFNKTLTARQNHSVQTTSSFSRKGKR